MLAKLRRDYRGRFGLDAGLCTVAGRVQEAERPRPARNLAVCVQARAHALAEAVRWGEPYVFFVAPGLLSWVVPLVEGETVHGGMSGGEVRLEEDAGDATATVNFLVSAGAPRRAAQEVVEAAPVWPQARARDAAAYLFETFYAMSGWKPVLLQRRRDNALQQRQIAEEIHSRKAELRPGYPLEEERLLLSLIRVGDRAGARRMLNTMLAAIFLHAPRPALLRARVIELMGYLVRAAVEDSPLLEPLLERQHVWMEKVLATEDFESLCVAVRDALDDFIDSIFRQGYERTNPKVRQALDYIAAHFAEDLRLDDVAQHVGLSTFRIAHMVKDYTGRTILQHVKRLRIEKARRLIEESALSCTEIAFAVGFSDQSFFTRQFREMTGSTPARYRRERRRVTPPAASRPSGP